MEPVLNWTIEVTHYRIKQTTARLGSSPAGSLFFLGDPTHQWYPRCPEKQIFYNRRGRASVPELSRFFGIVIAMYYDDHVPPHFHAIYGSEKAEFRIDPLGISRGDFAAGIGS